MQRVLVTLLFLCAGTPARPTVVLQPPLELRALVPSLAPNTGGTIHITGYGIGSTDSISVRLNVTTQGKCTKDPLVYQINSEDNPGNGIIFETGELAAGYYLVTVIRQRLDQPQAYTESSNSLLLWIYDYESPKLINAEPLVVNTLGGTHVLLRGSGILGPSEWFYRHPA